MSVMTKQVEMVKAMTDEKLQEAVAKCAGWQIITDSKGKHLLLPGESIVQFIHVGEPVRWLPTYTSSLDAIQKAVNDVVVPMDHLAMEIYVYNLLRARLGGEGNLDSDDPFLSVDLVNCANATARERCVAFVATMMKIKEAHDYRLCKNDDCQECQELIDAGLIMACDECGNPGSTASDGWTLLNNGRTLCNDCAAKPGMVCDTPGCSAYPVEDGVGPNAVPCVRCRDA